MGWPDNVVQFSLDTQNAISVLQNQKLRLISTVPYELYLKRLFIVWFGQRSFLNNSVAKIMKVL